MWDRCLILAAVLFIGLVGLGFVLHLKKVRRPRVFNRLNITFAATAVAAYLLVLPVQFSAGCGTVESFIITIQHMLQVFSLDGNYESLWSAVQCSTPGLQLFYWIFAACIFVLAPIMTVSVVLSFFHDFTAYLRLLWHRKRHIYLFSELNESSLLLARSCQEHEKKEGRKCVVVFTDVYDTNEETTSELQARAERIGALCFKKDILALRLPKGSKKLSFFIMGSNDPENIEHSMRLLSRHGQNEQAALYVFTSSTESTLLLGSVVSDEVRMKVRRINQAQSLVYNYLYNNNIFANAIDLPNGEKLLSVVILGMGRYGTEFLKAITWCGQVPGYRLEIHVFDQDRHAEARFTSMCPELMAMNGNDIPGESHYHITFHRSKDGRGISAFSGDFDQHIADIGDVSLAIVALGSDAADIEASMKLRVLLRRHNKERTPAIEAVVYQSVRTKTVPNYVLYDQKGNDTQIHFIGSLRETYSYDFVLNSELERDAEARHLKWCDKADPNAVRRETHRFYRFEYFYRSSIASAIRYKVRLRMGVPGIAKKPAERTIEERRAIQRMEHAGWNAYMRTEGYCCGPRDDLAKLHHLLIPFDELPESEQIKDDD